LLNGFLLVDKPSGITSFGVIAIIRKKFGMKKVGHTGTLDPLATGLMVVGIGKATKFLEFHTIHDKEYEAEITLGKISETYDAEGPITTTNSINIKPTIKEIESALNEFRGEIEQIPPKYCALKVNGEKLCNLVRRGKQVNANIKKRKITIYKNVIISYKYPVLKLRISCSSGTYIRSIAHDLGQTLSSGAYLSNLRRTKIDKLDIKKAKEIEFLTEKDILPMNLSLDFPIIELNYGHIERLKFGQRISLTKEGIKVPINNKYLQIYLGTEFQGIAEIKGEILKAKKMV